MGELKDGVTVPQLSRKAPSLCPIKQQRVAFVSREVMLYLTLKNLS